MQALKAKDIDYSVSYYHNDNDAGDKDVIYKRKQVLGQLPDLMYHGTSSKYLPNILRFGLSPDLGKINWTLLPPQYRDRVFLASRIEDSDFHAAHTANKAGGVPVILQFQIPDKNLIQPDYDVDTISTGPKTYIRNSGRDPYSPIASVSSDKLTKHSGLIAYKGRIPASFVRAVYLRINQQWKKVRLDTLKKRIDNDGSDFIYNYGLYD